jgi:nicotinamidase-related amidase
MHSLKTRSTVLLLIDVITDFEFEDGDVLIRRTLPAAKKTAALKKRAKKAGLPCVYVNDNFGKWQEDFKTMAAHFMRREAKGRNVVELLRPESDDYYVLKPHRSAFYSTTLEILLRELKANTLIIAGITTDICILFSANDAYMRGFELYVPSDCSAAVKSSHHRQTVEFMERVLKATISPSNELGFGSR